MIADQIVHRAQYSAVDARLERLLSVMAGYTPQNYPQGRMELDGDELFLLFAAYQTHSKAEAVMEAHRKYADVMYMVEGTETIYVKPTQALRTITAEYDPEKDALLAELDRDVTSVCLTAGQFVVLFPQDAHAPGCNDIQTAGVKKIIGKMKIMQD